MRINDSSRINGVNPYRKSNVGQTSASDMKKGKRDEVQISAEAKEMLGNASNTEKLEKLKDQISSGTYQVDAYKLADKLYPYFK
ncbi:flagellar biosynthesis anti-sigma factor FlgM [Paenibacillus turpanensis]|uniref:flagellar biosynthesis anti-sigma factor FlgM n=1 Tax=Paenibacillus turpanensis TaxID=2689078 RepID=UPI001409679C|nr:flagellar biosynthesis anti-sigma factor FlgM [Paenibacillus turpanensis]